MVSVGFQTKSRWSWLTSGSNEGTHSPSHGNETCSITSEVNGADLDGVSGGKSICGVAISTVSIGLDWCVKDHFDHSLNIAQQQAAKASAANNIFKSLAKTNKKMTQIVAAIPPM